jgi:type IV pilus assembly protein PilC
MLTYHYKARDNKDGSLVTGEVQADNEQAAVKLLMDRKLFPVSVSDEAPAGSLFSKSTRVKAKDRIIFTRQLSTLIGAGLPLVQSLRTVRDQVSSKPLQTIIDSVIASVEGGSTLSNAFAAHPKVFNQVYVSLIAAGESSGTLDGTLERLANQQEKDAAIASKIRGAMIYPLIVMAVVLGVLVFMLTTVLPQVGSLYKDLGKTLPFITQALLAISNFAVNFWWLVIIGVGGLGYAIYNYSKSTSGQRELDGLKLRLPVFGQLFMKVYMARYSRTLGTLVQSGLPLLQALDITKDAVNNVLVADTIDESIKQVRGGKALSTSIEGTKTFLPLVPQMIKIGEQSGTIDQMLDRLATFYEAEVDDEVKNLSTTLEPVMMVVLGLTVGLIVLAVLLPVYSLIGGGLT